MFLPIPVSLDYKGYRLVARYEPLSISEPPVDVYEGGRVFSRKLYRATSLDQAMRWIDERPGLPKESKFFVPAFLSSFWALTGHR